MVRIVYVQLRANRHRGMLFCVHAEEICVCLCVERAFAWGFAVAWNAWWNSNVCPLAVAIICCTHCAHTDTLVHRCSRTHISRTHSSVGQVLKTLCYGVCQVYTCMCPLSSILRRRLWVTSQVNKLCSTDQSSVHCLYALQTERIVIYELDGGYTHKHTQCFRMWLSVCVYVCLRVFKVRTRCTRTNKTTARAHRSVHSSSPLCQTQTRLRFSGHCSYVRSIYVCRRRRLHTHKHNYAQAPPPPTWISYPSIRPLSPSFRPSSAQLWQRGKHARQFNGEMCVQQNHLTLTVSVFFLLLFASFLACVSGTRTRTPLRQPHCWGSWLKLELWCPHMYA